MWKYVRYSLRIRRLEYRVAELPLFLIPVLLTVRDESAFLSAEFWEGLIIFLFLFAFGDLLNCLADRDLDAVYKPRFTEAVYGIGVRGVVLQAVLSAVGAVALAVHLAWLRDRWLLVPAVLLALVTAYAYSVPPLRLKGRGLWQIAFYVFGLFMGPMVFAAMLFRDVPGWGVIAVAFSYGLLQTGVLLVNTAEDLPEDRQTGMRTAIVALGLERGLLVAVFLAGIGGCTLLYQLLFAQIDKRNLTAIPWYVVPLALAWFGVLVGLLRLLRLVHQRSEDEGIRLVKRAGKWVPLGITAIAITTLISSLGAFLAARNPR